jgi:hypothetical protein
MNRLRLPSIVFIAITLCSCLLASAQTIIEEQQVVTPHRSRRIPAKDDIEAIGTRKVGGHAFGDWYSLQREIQMGQEYAKTIDDNSMINTNAVVSEYVNRVG